MACGLALVRVQLLDQFGDQGGIVRAGTADRRCVRRGRHAGRAETTVKPGPVRLSDVAEPSAQ